MIQIVHRGISCGQLITKLNSQLESKRLGQDQKNLILSVSSGNKQWPNFLTTTLLTMKFLLINGSLGIIENIMMNVVFSENLWLHWELKIIHRWISSGLTLLIGLLLSPVQYSVTICLSEYTRLMVPMPANILQITLNVKSSSFKTILTWKSISQLRKKLAISNISLSGTIKFQKIWIRILLVEF